MTKRLVEVLAKRVEEFKKDHPTAHFENFLEWLPTDYNTLMAIRSIPTYLIHLLFQSLSQPLYNSTNPFVELMKVTKSNPPYFKEFLQVFHPELNTDSLSEAEPHIQHEYFLLMYSYFKTVDELQFFSACLKLLEQQRYAELFMLFSLKYGMLIQQQNKEVQP